MRWIQPYQSPSLFSSLSSVSSSSSSPPPLQSPPSSSSSGNKISPAVLFIIVILAVIFFISGLLHLLVRFVIKKRTNSQSNNTPEMGPTDTYQRQLQQLFNLHDSGLDQAFIDALPVFLYKEIMGLKEPFDCAVCLCEFTEQDKLRLLPSCSHAFHIHCIDTWLFSNSTCPLCRGTLFTPGFSIENPIYDLYDARMEEEEDGYSGNIYIGANRHPMWRSDTDDLDRKEKRPKEACEGNIGNSSRVFSVRLGKFKTTSNDEGKEVREIGETSNGNLNARRCYSMGSCQYVLDDSELQVALCPSTREGRTKERLGQNGNSSIDGDSEGKKIIGSKGESFSVSKIWLWSKKDKFQSSSGSHLVNNSSLNISLPLRDTSRTQPLQLDSTQSLSQLFRFK